MRWLEGRVQGLNGLFDIAVFVILKSDCIVFGLLIFMKIVKIVATRSHILRQKCTKFKFSQS